MLTRRVFLERAAAGLATGAAAGEAESAPARRARLVEGVAAACRRLAGHGWRRLLLTASGGELDISGADLKGMLAKPLDRLDRTVPGFAEFSAAGRRAIEPGRPAESLLYHAFASPDVVQDGVGQVLTAFPTLAEIEAVENYVYGAEPPSLASLRERAGANPLGLVVFSLEYRRAAESTHGRHADLCFARTGIARLGTIEPRYDAQARAFDPVDPARPFAFRAMPQRFAAYLAMRVAGDSEGGVPRDFQEGDDGRSFWVPLHKLFEGRECVAGLDLRLQLTRHLRNEKLRRFHRYLVTEGMPSSWTGDDLERFPFVIADERIASFSRRPDFGSGVMEPRPGPLATRARYRGAWLTWEVPPDFVKRAGVMYFSSAQVIPGEPERFPTYMHGLGPTSDRPAPEYISLRHRVAPDGSVENLSERRDLTSVLEAGGYKAQHFIDFAGDGSVEARCPQIASEVRARVPAYCLVAPPDFFPAVSQRDLSVWWQREVDPAIRQALWAVPPTSLSERRMAANITLAAGFSINDTTVAALVSHPLASGAGAVSSVPLQANRYSGLPDASPGVFDPGWDTSIGQRFGDPETRQAFLQNYGLGTPFVEDVKLCAALGSYWPGVAPDSTRTFSPKKHGPGFPYPWPTIVPLTDIETGISPGPDGRFVPWDGVRGPRVETIEGRRRAVYADINRIDYLTGLDRMTPTLLARIDLAETKARVLAMASVYWALGLRDPAPPAERDPTDLERKALIDAVRAKAEWAVLSFRAVADEADPDLAAAEGATATRLTGTRRYRFHVFRPGEETEHPEDFRRVTVEMRDEIVAYTGPGQVLMRRGDGPWTRDTSMPTS